ncbi:RNA polymerase sigma-I factor [Halalkalibacter alkalisediminis]|uniref:RNA polymerase sigma factor SigI n=1 Tax=Halalkalibacter alkalisediminis TaxID=935616 RepID=A0ABV6NC32_9BACI|nr:RNA polymerase sigma-I factor [Halalkalibacter alkalisediminis]
MNAVDLQVIEQIQNGDEVARERVIQHYKPYVINVAGHITHKFVTWSDEEASIALLAFNKAIDTFDATAGRQFLNYVYLLIKRDLIDFYRKEKKEAHLSLHLTNEEESTIEQENNQAMELYEKQVQTTELVEEILELDALLRQYQISFEELEQHSPKHKDSRISLLELASLIAEDQECTELLQRKKKLPITIIVKKYGVKKKTLERHRKYLITLIILTLNRQWEQLSQFVKKEGKS